MIRPASAASPAFLTTQPASSAEPEPTEGSAGSYGPSFWAAYISNTLVCVGLALLFRYADFVTVLGGTEFHLGWIVGTGMIGSILMRLTLGDWIDRYGPRRVWVTSLAVYAATCVAHLAITRYDSPAIYALRIVLFTSLAGVFGASTSMVAGRRSVARMAQMVAMLGTSGFVGIMAGTLLGDVICGAEPSLAGATRMFLGAGLLGAAAMPFAWRATSAPFTAPTEARLPMRQVLSRHLSPVVAIAGMVGGASIAFPQIFLRTYAAQLDIGRLGWFFTVVAFVAVMTRYATRHLPQRLGLPRLILFSLAAMAGAQLLFLVVRHEWQLLFPAAAHGVAQAILFPMVTAAGVGNFPMRYRGLAMVAMMASFDLGQLVGSPLFGAVVHYAPAWGLPGYPTLFCSMAVSLLLCGTAYAISLRRPRRATVTPTVEPCLPHAEPSARMDGVRAGVRWTAHAPTPALPALPMIEGEPACESPTAPS